MTRTPATKRRARAVTLVVSALVCALALATPARAAGGKPGLAGVISSVSSDLTAVQAEAIWTVERMAAARPLDLARDVGHDLLGRDRDRLRPSYLPGFAPGHQPDGALRLIRGALDLPGLGSRSTSSAGGGRTYLAGPGFQRQRVDESSGRPPESYPFSTHGKLFGRFRGLGDYVCSATAVPANTGNVIMTAAHCVYDRRAKDGFAKNLTFVPGYHPDSVGTPVRPFGSFPASQLWVPRRYAKKEAISLDVAAVALSNNADGDSVSDTVGSRGIGFNQSRAHPVDAYGYPEEPPFDGIQQWMCDTQYTGNDSRLAGLPGPTPMRIVCDLTGGSSGGGWVIGAGGDEALTPGFVYSLISYSYPFVDEEGNLYGPYFGTDARRVWVAAQLNCRGSLPTQIGTAGPDVLRGTGKRDVILALGGSDRISGLAGKDKLCGGSGRDILIGRAGADQLNGQGGRDRLRAGRGKDRCDGGPGRDRGTGCKKRIRIP